MKTTQLVVSDPQFLAEFIGADEIKTFFEARYEVPPEYRWYLTRDITESERLALETEQLRTQLEQDRKSVV